ncbi:MAG: DUF1343 domain-containing protein [Candidatus Omnitrophica bacterium]|nr:DUF1343 domain-containing protein [Candidatus Omnitrophota bacterium]
MNWRMGLCIALAGWLPFSVAAEVRLGNEVLAQNGFKPLLGKRVGLLTNPSGVNRQKQSSVDLLRSARGIKLVALFAPEHGIRADVPAGKEFKDTVDPRTGLPVYSLYGPGPVRQPAPSMLKGMDALVYDLQDTGTRSYTFISTMGLAMEACAENNVEFVVLDRPNPLGGLRVEGPMLEPRFRSFVGQWQIPYVYGMTCGELARMINGEGWIRHRCQLTVIPMKGWRRGMVWQDTGLPWVPTSPFVPDGVTPMFLVATGVLGELGGLGIGAGSALRFQCVSAPWLNATRASNWLNDRRLPGVTFKQVTYRSAAGQTVNATRIFISDPARAPLMALNFYIWQAARLTGGHNLLADAMRTDRSLAMFDKVNGTDAPRKAMQAGRSAASIVAAWKTGEQRFRQLRQRYLIADYDTPTPTGSPVLVSTAPAARPASPPATKGPREHMVAAGDTLYRIAQTNDVSLEAITKMNPGVKADSLQIGQKIRIPQ